MNLLPPKERKILRRDYFFRFLATGCLMFFLGTVIGIGTLLAPYILAESRITELHAEVKNVGTTSNNKLTDIQKEIDVSSKMLGVLLPSQGTIITDSIQKIIVLKPSGVKVSSFSYQQGKGTTATINVQAVAKSRNDVLLFIQNLQHEPKFSDVTVPVSDFAKSENINFSLSLTVQIK